MSKLDELIAELCPDGVEYKKIKQVYKRLKGTPITAGKMKEIDNPNGEIRIFAGGKTVINAMEKDIPNANITRVPAVLVQSRGVIDAVYYDKPFTFKNEMWAYTADDTIAVKYLYYVLKNNLSYFRKAASGMGSLPQISLPVTEEFVIPVPPLPVQQEIVRILDNFTELTTQLTAELKAEIEARKKQYKYYRDWLLSQEGLNKLCPDGVEYSKLDSICNLITTGKLNANAMVENGKYPFFTCDANPYRINEYAFDTTAIIISGNGSQVGHINFYQGKFNAYQRTYVLSEFNNVDVKYLLHYLKGNLNNYIILHSKKGSVPYITMPMLKNFSVPVPPMPVQQEIVRILDNFTESTAELRVELETELEARQKQYEYYRDKLLTFPARSKDVKESKEATA